MKLSVQEFRDWKHKSITLLGMSGVGKTRLSNMLRRHQYDVVVSDINRSEGSDAGLQMVSRMKELGLYRRTIFYVLSLQPGVPEGAFNITNRPDHLLHFIMDVLERERWSDLPDKAD